MTTVRISNATVTGTPVFRVYRTDLAKPKAVTRLPATPGATEGEWAGPVAGAGKGRVPGVVVAGIDPRLVRGDILLHPASLPKAFPCTAGRSAAEIGCLHARPHGLCRRGGQ